MKVYSKFIKLVKTGLAREENIMRQNKLIADLFTIKQNTTNIITGMIN